VDGNGAALGPVRKLEGTGWGEQDQLVPLGPGRVAWAYIANPALTVLTGKEQYKYAPCKSPSLQLSVYTSGK
jgi:hypothetical protein